MDNKAEKLELELRRFLADANEERSRAMLSTPMQVGPLTLTSWIKQAEEVAKQLQVMLLWLEVQELARENADKLGIKLGENISSGVLRYLERQLKKDK